MQLTLTTSDAVYKIDHDLPSSSNDYEYRVFANIANNQNARLMLCMMHATHRTTFVYIALAYLNLYC